MAKLECLKINSDEKIDMIIELNNSADLDAISSISHLLTTIDEVYYVFSFKFLSESDIKIRKQDIQMKLLNKLSNNHFSLLVAFACISNLLKASKNYIKLFDDLLLLFDKSESIEYFYNEMKILLKKITGSSGIEEIDVNSILTLIFKIYIKYKNNGKLLNNRMIYKIYNLLNNYNELGDAFIISILKYNQRKRGVKVKDANDLLKIINCDILWCQKNMFRLVSIEEVKIDEFYEKTRNYVEVLRKIGVWKKFKFNGGRKCFALLCNSNDNKIYYSISGLKIFEQTYIKSIENLIGYNYIKCIINSDMRCYFDYEKYINLKDAYNYVKNTTDNISLIKLLNNELESLFTCCERKILSNLNGKIDGILYVKYSPCKICSYTLGDFNKIDSISVKYAKKYYNGDNVNYKIEIAKRIFNDQSLCS